MCGIAGWIGAETSSSDAEVGQMMIASLRHRGPDGAGECELHGDGLHGWMGHQRLKIIDTSDAASQPMSSDDGAIILTYNGEIYNFRELRRELEGRGHVFRSSGDTEVVLRAYEAWGDDFVTRLDGMFALAIWDARSRHVLLARDRTGKKPLFYSTSGRRLTFGSEAKAVVAAPWVTREIAADRLAEFLTFGYVAAPNTLLASVRQVPPGCVVVYDRRGLGDPQEYWDPQPRGGGRAASTREVVSSLPALLESAVRRRMVADVPVGALLSGGIDSSLIVALMTRLSDEPIKTFSIGFSDDSSFDERPWARMVADRFGTDHTERVVEIDAVGLLDRLLWHHDLPFADSSAIPTYLVCAVARQDVTVVLTGDGGDEVFGGYERFTAARIAGWVPRALNGLGKNAAGLLPSGASYHSKRRRLERFFEGSGGSIEQRYRRWISVLSSEAVQSALMAVPAAADDPMDRWLQRARTGPALDRILYMNLRTYLPEDLSVKLDRMSMAVSLEARCPFLDTALVEQMARLPARKKVGIRHVKPLLRHAFGDLLPTEIWNRPKHGFGVPMDRWFCSSLADVFGDEVLGRDARSRAYLDHAVLASMLADHRSGRASHGAELWTLLTLERWLRAIERPWVMPTADAFAG